MRKSLSAILILIVFLSLQFGKISSYLYCKWQVEFLQKQKDCGCDDHLVAMFDHNEPTNEGMVLHNKLNEKITEYSLHFLTVNLSLSSLEVKNCFAEYDSPLCSNVLDSPFHPPAA